MEFTETGELGAHRSQLAAITELGLRAMEDVDLPVLMDEAVSLVAENLAVEYAKIFALQPDGESLLLCSGVGWAEGVVGQATVGTQPDSRAFFLPAGYRLASEDTLVSEEPEIVENLPAERRSSGPPLPREHEVRSTISVIIHGQERPFGVLGADTCKQRRFTIDDVNFLQAVANVLATAIECRQVAHVKAETPRLRFELLAEASMLLTSSPDCSSTLACIARLVVPEFADCCTVEVLEEGGAIQSAVAHVDPAKEDPLRKLQACYPLDASNTSSSASEVLRTGRSKIVPDISDIMPTYVAEDAEDLKMFRAELHAESYMCVPLMTRGRLLGVIRLAYVKLGRRYGSEDLALAESLARFAALAIENARLHLPEVEIARGLVNLAKKFYRISPSSEGNVIADLVPQPSLTTRQRQVLELLSEGKIAKEIAQTLCLSEPTIRNHIRSLLQALGVRSQLEAVAQAREIGLLP